VSFEVAAIAYDRFMGRWSSPLAPSFTDFGGVTKGLRVLDVGCGPGALTDELVGRVGQTAVAAVDPSLAFLTAAQGRHPKVDVRQSTAERLPFDDDTFDSSLAQLVVHFMKDPIVGLQEMARVTVDHGTVVACVWDHASGGGPLSLFWEAAHGLDGTVRDESQLAGARQGHLGQLFCDSGLNEVEETLLTVSVEHPSFDDWWEPYTLGVGPAGKYVQGLDTARQARLRERCRQLLPTAPFTLTASAWAARGLA
jgi:SAM-dependent methyltransferase